MQFVAGIDPGLSGAIAIYERDEDRLIDVWDIPTIVVRISGKERKRLDMPQLRSRFEWLQNIYGVSLICVERVQGYGGKMQSASAAFQFGEVFGRIMALAEDAAPLVDGPSPAVWKLREKVPLDAKAIVAMAQREFPVHAHLFKGPKGGTLHDRAEAAFLARYAARRVMPFLALYAARRVMPLLATKGSITDIEVVDVDKLGALPRHAAAPGKRSAITVLGFQADTAGRSAKRVVAAAVRAADTGRVAKQERKTRKAK